MLLKAGQWRNRDESMAPAGGTMRRKYPSRPILAVGAIILRRGRILLVQRGRAPLKGYRCRAGRWNSESVWRTGFAARSSKRPA